MLPTKPGCYKDIAIDTYHSDITYASASTLKMARKGTRSFVHSLIKAKETKTHFDFGNAFELALIDYYTGSEFFKNEVAVMPSLEWITEANMIRKAVGKDKYKTPANSKHYQSCKHEFELENFDKYIIVDFTDKESYADIKGMIKTLSVDPTIKRLLSNTEYQNSLIWKDKETGLMCKTRPDLNKSKKPVLLDIKTTKDAGERNFAKDAANFDYPVQAIMQIEGAMQSGLYEEVEAYFWIAVEKEPPYNYGIYTFQKDDWEWAKGIYRHLLMRAAKGINHIQKGTPIEEIPSYGLDDNFNSDKHGIMALELPLWYQNTL